MAGGITVQINGGELERTIHRLTTRVVLADVAVNELVEEELKHGENIARKNIQQYVYAIPQGSNTRYKRTYDLLNSVKSGKIRSKGAIASGELYISREKFHRVYYPVFVEHGRDAGAPYEGRHFWAVTIAELRSDTTRKAIIAGRRIAKGI